MYKYLVYLSSKLDKKRKLWGNIVNKLEAIINDEDLVPAAIHYDLGLAYCKLKKWNDASKHLSKAIVLKPNKLSWKYRYAVALENSGNKEKSKSIIEFIYFENNLDDKKHFNSGMLLLGYSRPIEAERAFNKAIEINANNYKYYLGLVMALNRQGKGKSWVVIESLLKAVIINPKSTEIHYTLGLNYEYMRNYHLAIFSYVKTILNKKNNKILSELLSIIKNELEKQKNILIKITTIENESDKLFKDGLNSFEENPVEAESYFRGAIELNSDKKEYYVGLASALEKQGEAKLWQELDALQSAVTMGLKSATKFYRVGIIREKMNNFLNASQAYKVALDSGLVDSEIFYRLGFCLKMIGEESASNQSFESAISYDKKLNSSRFGIGVFHNKFGKKQLAIEAFKKQGEKKPQDGELFYKLGMALDRCYKWNEAKKAYKRAIKIDPSVYEWQYRLGFVFERLKNYKEATYWYTKATEGKKVPYWYYRLGYALHNIKNYKAACEAFIITHDALEAPSAVFRENDCLAVQFYNIALQHEGCGEYEKSSEFLIDAINSREGTAGYLFYRLACIEYKKGNYQHSCSHFINSRILQEPHGVSDENYRKNENVKKFSDYNFYSERKSIVKNSILYESFQGSSISCNPLAMFLEIYYREEFAGFRHFWVINDISNVPDYIKELDNVYFVKHNSDLYLESLATSRLLINNSTFPPYFTKRKEQLYINTWHGTPLKTLGKDMKGRFLEHKNFTRNILQSDILLSPNEFTTKVLRSSHDINGIYTGTILESGYPRIDLTLSFSESRRQSITNQMSLDDAKTTILYAPTWRGTHGEISFNKEQLVNDLTRLAEIPNSIIIFRGHSLLENVLGELDIPGVRILAKNIDTNEFLSLVDILITDYSSIFFDYYPTKKPVFYYTYDLEEYSESRGIYINLESLPGIVSNDIDSLVKEVNSCIIRDQSLANAELLFDLGFNNYDDGKATKRVISSIIEKMNNPNSYKQSQDKIKTNKSFLFYTGPFMRNGITTSFINLANNLISQGHTVSVVVDANAIAKHDDRLEQISKLHENVNLIGRVGGIVFNLEERYIHGERNRDHSLPEVEMEEVWLSSWRKEFKRIFGDAHFDCIINFEGYTNFWSSLFSAQSHLKRNIYQHNDMYSEYTQKYPYLLGGFNNYRHYDNVISVSKETRDLNFKNLSKIIEADNDKYVYSQNLLNLDTIFKMSNESILCEDKHIFESKGPIFINIGRLSIEKDHAKLLRAFKAMHDSIPHSTLIILGEGALKSDLIKLINKLELNKSVHLLGHRLNPYPYLAKANCFVLSSNHEGQPMTLLEAFTLGKDVIATSIAGNNSVLKLVEEVGVPNTVKGLSSALIEYANNGKQQKSFLYNTYQDEAVKTFIDYTH
ncbi:CDP-glycerol glycerophosphotransferase family protein [Rouxiella silvae]|uniref:CDP-glycerol glycerophosphotransferase family protein n=1 Tax=Rouxiella silvae TaxID=1646373 RepID=UPI0039F0DE4E